MAAAQAAWQVVSLRFLDRVGKGIRTAPRDAIISDSVHTVHRGLAFSFHRAMDHSGAVLGPLVAGLFLYLLLGKRIWVQVPQDASSETIRALRWLFASALVPGVAAVAFLAFGVREIAPPPVSPRDGVGVGRGAWRSLPGSFFGFAAVVTVFALGNSSDLFLLLYGQTRFGIGVGAALALWIALHLSKIVFSFAGGILSDRLGRRGVIATGWLV
jgi:MFS family permease